MGLTHYCPNVVRHDPFKSLKYGRKMSKRSVIDLNLNSAICHPASNTLAGAIDVCRQADFCSGHGTPAAAHVSALRGALQRRAQGQTVFVPRSVSDDGLCSTHLSREVCAISKRACVRNPPSFTTWGFALRWRAIRWPTPMPCAIGAFTATSLRV